MTVNPVGQRRPLLRLMKPRDPQEHPRAATPLELLYDLCFVVAIAQLAAGLHHAVAEGHGLEGLVGFITVFFAIWWAWMGFAWFASAFDTDDTAYRLKVLVQMVGVLVLAAGVPRAFEGRGYLLITAGYLIMRTGLIGQWLRASRSDPNLRATARRYVIGTTAVQLGWLALLALPVEHWIFGWMVLVPCELLVPWWAEAAGPTPWHAHHIAERYGLLTIIVIGESVLAATLAIQKAIELGGLPGALVAVIVSAPAILFAMWWLYFCRPAHELLTSRRAAFAWGYGHVLIFGSAAAAGAGLAVLVDQAVGHGHVSDFWAGQSLAIPVALFLMSGWLFHGRRAWSSRSERVAVLVASVLVLAAPATGATAPLIAVVLAVLTAAATRMRDPVAE